VTLKMRFSISRTSARIVAHIYYAGILSIPKTAKGENMPVIKVSKDIHERLMNDRDADHVSASSVVEWLYQKNEQKNEAQII